MEILARKTVLVTGGTGFIGSHLVDSLIAKKCRVVVTYRSIDPRSYFATQKLSESVHMAMCDVEDFGRVTDLVTKHEIDYIIHMAAQVIVTTALTNPLKTIQSNVMGTTNILEASRLHAHVKGIVVASSDKAYGKASSAYVEEDPLRGDHPYEVSKSAADLIAHAYAKTYKLPVIVARMGNTYGPGDLHFSRIIPGLAKTLVTGEKIKIRSDGTFVRDYIYVKDVVDAYVFLLQRVKKLQGHAFNISSPHTHSVLELIAQVEKVFGVKIPHVIENSQVNEIPFQSLKYEKIKKAGWKPKYTLKKALKETHAWYEKHKQALF